MFVLNVYKYNKFSLLIDYIYIYVNCYLTLLYILYIKNNWLKDMLSSKSNLLV